MISHLPRFYKFLGLPLFLLIGVSIRVRASTDMLDMQYSSSTLSDLASAVNSETDPVRQQQLENYLETTAVPKTSEDVQQVLSDLQSSEEIRRHRALLQLDRVEDLNLAAAVHNAFVEMSTRLPPESTENSSALKDDGEITSDEKAIAHLMSKLSSLKDQSSIPLIRKYARQRHSEALNEQATSSLAQLSDAQSFGADRRTQLLHGYLDPKDPGLKAWLKQTMINDPRLDIRLKAGAAYAETIADPTSLEDMEFAKNTLVASKNPDDELNGCRILARRAAAGLVESQTFDAMTSLLKNSKANHAAAIDALQAIGEHSTYRSRVLDTLNGYLRSPTPVRRNAKSRAQEVIAHFTGVYPHYDGEGFCSQHPLKFPDGTIYPNGQHH